MISCRKDFLEYYNEDIRATGLDNSFSSHIKDRRYHFYWLLRKTEYYYNCRKDFLGKIIGKLLYYRYLKLCDSYSWTIPINVFGKGLQLVHAGTIVVSGSAKVGNYSRVHAGVNIGHAYTHGESGAPVVGDYVYFGPGAKLFGPIEIGSYTCIGANAVVNKSFPQGKCTIAGVPAKIISNNTSDKYMIV